MEPCSPKNWSIFDACLQPWKGIHGILSEFRTVQADDNSAGDDCSVCAGRQHLSPWSDECPQNALAQGRTGTAGRSGSVHEDHTLVFHSAKSQPAWLAQQVPISEPRTPIRSARCE